MKHIARKRFGQHFLTDPSVIEAIVKCIDPRVGQSMIEIGPGLAALTQPLVERLGQLTVIALAFGAFTRDSNVCDAYGSCTTEFWWNPVPLIVVAVIVGAATDHGNSNSGSSGGTSGGGGGPNGARNGLERE